MGLAQPRPIYVALSIVSSVPIIPSHHTMSFPLFHPLSSALSHLLSSIIPSSLTCHIVEVEVTGPGTDDNHFTVHTVRTNPASSGAVTGKQTYVSFFSSVTGKSCDYSGWSCDCNRPL